MIRPAPTVTCGMTRLRGRLPLHLFGAVVFAALTVLAASCSSSPSSAGGSSSTSTTAVSTTTTTTSEATKVLAAYSAEWRAFEHALTTANAYDPALSATMVSPQLQSVRRNLLADHAEGIVGRGSFTLHPRVVSMTATTATVVDCAYSTAKLVYAKNGKPVPPITPPEHDGVRATLVLAGSTWKVARQSVTDGRCSASF